MNSGTYCTRIPFFEIRADHENTAAFLLLNKRADVNATEENSISDLVPACGADRDRIEALGGRGRSGSERSIPDDTHDDGSRKRPPGN